MNVLHAVIRPTPGQDRRVPPRTRVDHQKRAAREVLAMAAELQGLSFGALPRDEHGAPRAVDGNHWSITHTSDYVGGVAAPWPLGIDIERVRRPRAEVVEAAASEAELDVVGRLYDETQEEAFTRIWSAKEALLKLTGEGLCGLSKATLSPLADREFRPGLWLRHNDADHFIHQERSGDHYASVACAPISHVSWDWEHAAETLPQLLKSGDR